MLTSGSLEPHGHPGQALPGIIGPAVTPQPGPACDGSNPEEIELARSASPAPRIVGGNVPEWTVSDLSRAVKNTVENSFGHLRVRGEIGGISKPASGHCYFHLKDEGGVLAAVIWRSRAAHVALQPTEGQEVVATGRLTIYGRQSKYQLVVEQLEFAGEGAILASIERLRRKLQREGLFDEERKQPLPILPDVIGVVTSPSGAVIHDILTRVRSRLPRRVILWPVAVQGPDSAREVTASIRGFNQLAESGPVPRPDVIIVARGGGSVEDLASFSDEAVVRAIADSRIPVISAIGHETDLALSDFAADRRAPTPTAAAEFAVPERTTLRARVANLDGRRHQVLDRHLRQLHLRLDSRSAVLPRPEHFLAQPTQRVDMASLSLSRNATDQLGDIEGRLQGANLRLQPRLLRNIATHHGRAVAESGQKLTRALVVFYRIHDRRAQTAFGRLRPERLSRIHRQADVALSATFDRLQGREAELASLQQQNVEAMAARLWRARPNRALLLGKDKVSSLSDRLSEWNPGQVGSAARFENAEHALNPKLLHRRSREASGRLKTAGRLLENLGYRKTLARGFAVVRNRHTNELVTKSDKVASGTALAIRFAQGEPLHAVTEPRNGG